MLQSPDIDGLQRLSWTFAEHRTITAAANTGILNLLAERSATCAEVAELLNLSPAPCAKIMRALTALGVVTRQDERFAVVEPLVRYFRDGSDDIKPFLVHSRRMYEGWGEHLENWIRGHGWPHGPRSPEQALAFAAAMRAMGRHTALSVRARLDLSGTQTLLDVGGGHGHWAEVFCEAHPDLRATVLDTPETAATGRARLEGSPLANRIDFTGGDYLVPPIGHDYDVVLLANILHQESAEDAQRLVHNGASALASGGRLVIVDFRIDDDRCGPLLGALFAINMRDFGDTWTEPEIRNWMESAGLENISRQDIGPDRWFFTGCTGGSQLASGRCT